MNETRPTEVTPMYGTVEHVEPVGASMVRVTLGGPGLDGFEPIDRTDQYVNALFVPSEADYRAPFDVDAVRALDATLRPRGRRYTVRSWDPVARRLALDFVVHGDVGHAGRWAQRAQVGDTLQILGPGGGYRPDPDADWYLLAGDESALPAIAASLEVVAPDRSSVVLVVVDGPGSEVELTSPGDLEVRWLHRSTASRPEDLLSTGLAALTWRPGAVDVFVHGEAAEVRSARRHLVDVRGVDARSASISPYWRRDHTDEAWRAIKEQWLAEQDADANA